ncbi:MAG: DNA/RNA nuclease SfsA [Thaumarchaeota archaeon]|nr:DNA/RNA nuclease SfsA [Candidatus Calditenuaceae archaeon]MDW8187018.1 DNA/RNA nuclease SfsA [Nitrososphaerota archaeon]
MLLRLALKRSKFVSRPNRFLLIAESGGELLKLHNRNTGRLGELLRAGAELFYVPRDADRSSPTVGTLIGVSTDEGIALIDPPTQARAFEYAWRSGCVNWLNRWYLVGKEVKVCDVRLDYEMLGPRGKVGYLELKSAVYLDPLGRCSYPDVPSERGLRHVRTLKAIRRRGVRAVMALVAAHPSCRSFRPFVERHPELASEFMRASEAGVEIRALKVVLSREGCVSLVEPDLPVLLT